MTAKQGQKDTPMAAKKASADELRVYKTEEEWREILTPEQFDIARKHGTERAFTGPDWDTKDAGLYRCVACDNELFRSETKFDSGTGWPSFYEPVRPQAVREFSDRSFFMVRTEVRCADCDSHLGHVFKDGPQPTGLRYCMNGTVMNFIPDNA